MRIGTDENGNTLETGFFPADRYHFDFGMCSKKNGWKQYDTDQDAWYFGIWVHIEKRQIFSYVEGDTYLTTCKTPEAFRAELDRMGEQYGPPPPAFRTVGSDGTITHYFGERPTAG